MRKHFQHYDRAECGELAVCEIGFESLIPPVVGGLVNTVFADEDAAYTQPTLTTTEEPWGPAVAPAETIIGDAGNIYGTGGFAPIVNPLQLMGRANLLGYAEDTLPGLIGTAQGSWLQGLQPGLDPYVGAMIQSAQNDLVQDYRRNILPSISEQAQRVGGYGGSRQGVAEGIAAEGLAEALGDVSTNLLSDAYGQALGQQRAAWAAAPNMLGFGFMPAQTQMEVGDLYRTDLMQPAQNLMGYQGVTLPYFTAPFGTTTVPNLRYQPPANQFLSGAAAGTQLWNDISGMFNTGTPPGTGGAAVPPAPVGTGTGTMSNWAQLQNQLF